MHTGAQAAYAYALGQIGDVLEVMPGEEFRVAVQEAQKVSAVSQAACLILLVANLTQERSHSTFPEADYLSSPAIMHYAACVLLRDQLLCLRSHLLCLRSQLTKPDLQVGAQIMLGDRRLHITVARVWGNLSYWDKLRLVSTLLYTGIRPASKDEITKEMEKMKVCQLAHVCDCVWAHSCCPQQPPSLAARAITQPCCQQEAGKIHRVAQSFPSTSCTSAAERGVAHAQGIDSA